MPQAIAQGLDRDKVPIHKAELHARSFVALVNGLFPMTIVDTPEPRDSPTMHMHTRSTVLTLRLHQHQYRRPMSLRLC